MEIDEENCEWTSEAWRSGNALSVGRGNEGNDERRNDGEMAIRNWASDSRNIAMTNEVTRIRRETCDMRKFGVNDGASGARSGRASDAVCESRNNGVIDEGRIDTQ